VKKILIYTPELADELDGKIMEALKGSV